jgi:hypothetical protein
MSHEHRHGQVRHAVASVPTLSLLRLSAVQRVAGACVLLAALWALVFLVMA